MRLEALGLTEDEVAFYDALAANESAVQAMGDAKLKRVTIDWTLRESAREDQGDGEYTPRFAKNDGRMLSVARRARVLLVERESDEGISDERYGQ